MSEQRDTGGSEADQAVPAPTADRQEYVQDVNETLAFAMPYAGEDPLRILCECGGPECNEWISVTTEDYGYVRDQAGWRIVLQGHEQPGTDEIKERRETFAIVKTVSRQAGD